MDALIKMRDYARVPSIHQVMKVCGVIPKMVIGASVYAALIISYIEEGKIPDVKGKQ